MNVNIARVRKRLILPSYVRKPSELPFQCKITIDSQNLNLWETDHLFIQNHWRAAVKSSKSVDLIQNSGLELGKRIRKNHTYINIYGQVVYQDLFDNLCKVCIIS